MKKILLPALCALCAPVMAQSSVTIYGVVDGAIGRTKNGDVSRTQQLSGVANGSRLGYRGSEDLGGGLRAEFTLESGISLNNGNFTQGGLPFGRQSFVRLASSDGWTVSAGRQFSPVTNSMVAADPMGWQYFGNTLGTGIGFHESPGEGPTTGGFQSTGRVNNSVFGSYKTGAFLAQSMIAFGDETLKGHGRLMSASLTYEADGLMLTAAGARFRQFANSIAATADPEWQNQYLLGARYDLKGAKLYAGYYGFKPSMNGRGGVAPTSLDPRFERSTTVWVGAKIAVGIGSVYVNAMRSTYSYSQFEDGKGTTLGFAYEHPLSKRTALYASYGRVKNNATGLTPLYAAIPVLIPSATGADLAGYAFGIRHAF